MTQLYTAFKKYHKWPALIFTVFFIFFSISGILMNHRELISSIDINRKYLPNDYELQNWNLASIKGSKALNADTVFFYGGAGIWITNQNFSSWIPFMNEIPRGSDNRKIFDFEKSSNGSYFAATRFGLYHFNKPQQKWIKCQLPKSDEFVTGIEIVDSTIYITTRNSLYTAKDVDENFIFTKAVLISPTGSNPNMSIFRLFWIIHSGEILGISGRIIVDIVGIIMLFLSITGLIYFISPKIVKRVKGRFKLRRTKQATKFSYKWHLKVGLISALLLLIVSFTGIFLRPPFLLFVVSGNITHSENSAQKNDKFWHDKIRDIKYDKAKKLFLIATSDGIFYGKEFNKPLCKFKSEPPISVMGINVFEILENGNYLIGSFSGAFQWHPTDGTIYNYITGQEVVPTYNMSSPFGSVAVSGYSKINNDEYFFDYDKGVLPMRQNQKDIAMPKLVKNSFRFPLWNLAQEFHTCRIYSPIISSFYILIVPLAGISLIIITITGFAMWLIKRRGKRQQIQF